MADAVVIPKAINDKEQNVFSEIHDHVRAIISLLDTLKDEKPKQSTAKQMAKGHMIFFEENQLHEVRTAFE